MSPQVEALIREKGTIRLRHIDIGTWESEVATEHRIRRLPALKLYEGRKLVSEDKDEVLEILSS